MKATTTYAMLAFATTALANGPGGPGGPGGGGGGGGFGFGGGWGGNGWGGPGPQCASSCFSSFWATATPTPTAFCSGPALASCVTRACTTETAALSSYSSISSSLCSKFSACTTTGTFTYTYPTSDWWGGRGNYPTGPVTVTGCPWDGGEWGWGFWGNGGGPGGGRWGDFGPGWVYATRTTTVTRTVTGSNGARTTVGLATVAQAVSGESTLLTTFTGAEEAIATGGAATVTPNAAPETDLNAVKVMGACLGAVVAVAGVL